MIKCQRWHLHPALIVVATLSLTSVFVGMRYVTISQSSKRLKDGLMLSLPVNSRSNDDYSSDASDVVSSDPDDNRAGDIPPIDSYPEDIQPHNDITSNEANAAVPTSTQSKSNDEQFTEEKSDGAADDASSLRGNSNDRQFFNQKKVDGAPPVHQQQRQAHVPRMISFDGSNDNNTFNISRGERDIYISKLARKEQKRLMDSDDFSYRDPLYEGECVPMQKWQETSFPNCNTIHELDFYGKSRTDEFEYWQHGGYNDIFWIDEKDKKEDPELIMKILQYGTTYSDRNFDRVRRDGLILERLTKSPYVLDTYGFCGFDVLTPYANGGTLSSRLRAWRKGTKVPQKTRLKYAFEAAAGLAAVHDIDGEGMSSVAHGDLKGGQYLFVDDELKLGDFNRGRFLRRNSTAPDTGCTYTIGKNDAAFRSPEEYEYLPQTSAIDVYALGSILYQLLTGKEVWYDTDTKKAQKYIRRGKLPAIPDRLLDSKDPVDIALREAISMCYKFDPKKRAKASEVASFLEKAFVAVSAEGSSLGDSVKKLISASWQ